MDLDELTKAVESLESVCHSRSGLLCDHEGPESPNENWCNVHIARAEVLALIAARKEPRRPRHDPTDHDCRGGVPGDRYPV